MSESESLPLNIADRILPENAFDRNDYATARRIRPSSPLSRYLFITSDVTPPSDVLLQVILSGGRILSQPYTRSSINTSSYWYLYRDAGRILLTNWLQVRGTPSSGKTVLSVLIFEYIRERGDRVVLGVPDRSASGSMYFQKKDIAPGDGSVLLLDEAQASYEDLELWTIFKSIGDKFINNRVIAFISYGSTTSDYTVPGSTPIIVPICRQVTLRPIDHNDGTPPVGLFLSPTEFDNLAAVWADQFHFDRTFYKWVYKITSGPVGAARDLVSYISCHDVRDWWW